MKQTLYLFNPDTDMALANGDENYVPPAHIAKMADDLAFLPAWYRDGAGLLLPSVGFLEEFSSEWYRDLCPEFCCPGINCGAFNGLTEVFPWGWNAGLAKKMRLMGIPEKIIPSWEVIGKIREYAHRSFSVSVLDAMLGAEFICGSSVCLRSEREVRFFLEQIPHAVLKAPWSGSGKGLYWYRRGEDSRLMELWVRKVIEKQGCLVADRVYDKEEDFAMEFYSDGCGTVRFAGYSLFRTDKWGVYKGNLLASDQYIESRLARYVATGVLADIKEKLETLLALAVGTFYKGYLGVDMMVCRFDEKPYYRIYPCIEVNLRMNMGMVSRLVYDRYVVPGRVGDFAVDYFKTPAALLENHRVLADKYPLVVQDGKVVAGYLPLTPVGTTTNYRVSIRII